MSLHRMKYVLISLASNSHDAELKIFILSTIKKEMKLQRSGCVNNSDTTQ